MKYTTHTDGKTGHHQRLCHDHLSQFMQQGPALAQAFASSSGRQPPVDYTYRFGLVTPLEARVAISAQSGWARASSSNGNNSPSSRRRAGPIDVHVRVFPCEPVTWRNGSRPSPIGANLRQTPPSPAAL